MKFTINKQATVFRKIIDCLTHNLNSEKNEKCQKRKLRKCLAIDLFISATLRYISPLSLAPMPLQRHRQ